MQINRIELENFGSHASSALDLRDRGLVLIEGENRDQGGSNGAGKSTIFEGLCWSLFGATNSGLRGQDVLRVGSSKATVKVVLDIDGTTVEVTRTRDSKTAGLELKIDGQVATGASTKDTQFKLARLLQLDWGSFVSVVMFPQSKPGIASQTDGEQKSVLDTILSLGRFARARLRVRDLCDDTKARHTKITVELGQLEARRNAQQETLVRLKEQKLGFTNQQRMKINSLSKQITEFANQKPENTQTLTNHLAGLSQKLDEQRAQGEQALNVYQQLSMKLNHVQSELTRTEADIKVTTHQIIELKVLDPDEEMAKNDTCPACDQQLPEKARASLYQTFSSQARETQRKKDQLIAQCSDLNGKAVKLMGAVNELVAHQENAKEALVDTSALELEIKSIELQIQSRQHELVSHARQLEAMRLQLGQETAKNNPFVSAVAQEVAALEEGATRIESKQKELQPLGEELRDMEFWLEGFGNRGVKSLLMSTVTPFLNQRANAYMQELSNNTASIKIQTQTKLRSGEFRDKLEFQVSYPGGSELYLGKSGGEKRRADISILFALGDLAATRARAPVELRLLDEPFESLDSLGCEQVVRLLRAHVLPRARTILVMSHNEALKTLFEHRIKVVKENGVSRIEAA